VSADASSLYRLATIHRDGTTMAVVERGGAMLGIAQLLQLPEPFASLDPVIADWPAMQGRIEAALATAGDQFDRSGFAAAGVRFASPLATPGSFICIGANYHDHVAEMPVPMNPTYPYAFLKPVRNTLRASGETVPKPREVARMDWEAELGVVIGTTCRNVSEADALGVIAGYVNFNDLSARDWIASRPAIGIDWVRHKGYDGFAPMGPYVVPARFIADPQDLPIRLTVNGVVKQNSSTAQMIFGVAPIIAHLTSIMTLHPGDVIATGSPAGVGHGRKPPEYLSVGDAIVMEIGMMGELYTTIE